MRGIQLKHRIDSSKSAMKGWAVLCFFGGPAIWILGAPWLPAMGLAAFVRPNDQISLDGSRNENS